MPNDEQSHGRWFDALLIQMNGTVGEVREAINEARNDRREMWECLNDTHTP